MGFEPPAGCLKRSQVHPEFQPDASTFSSRVSQPVGGRIFVFDNYDFHVPCGIKERQLHAEYRVALVDTDVLLCKQLIPFHNILQPQLG